MCNQSYLTCFSRCSPIGHGRRGREDPKNVKQMKYYKFTSARASEADDDNPYGKRMDKPNIP
uniref:Uncharacterized protein n=1 Tax=Romanomermis culicivorax TaxID=13658 RepID=A0A915HJZ6_ROMCU